MTLLSDLAAPKACHQIPLTNRERQIAALVCHALANKIIAQKLSISEGTVKQHLHAIYQKLGVPRRAGLIIALSDRTMRPAGVG